MSQFPSNLEFAYAGRLKKEISSLFSGSKAIVLDFRNVERASLACIQIVVAAHQKAQKEKLQFVIEASEKFTTILKQLGLDFILHDERTS